MIPVEQNEEQMKPEEPHEVSTQQRIRSLCANCGNTRQYQPRLKIHRTEAHVATSADLLRIERFACVTCGKTSEFKLKFALHIRKLLETFFC